MTGDELVESRLAIWAEVWDIALAFAAYFGDPESDYDLILAVEEHLGVTHP
ncbi:hypothetical protein [Streptomyces sp. NPDC048057]|uniref:DUF7215 family protein n=1 Tax=Streptomyces sp. NPDC048057 TaxID=3155628 RepID=UPI0033DEA875